MSHGPGIVIWFTGLSGSGKSTLAEGVTARLEADGMRVLTLDGDDVRRRYHRHLGFSEAEVKKNNMLIAEICAERRAEFDVVLVPIISPFIESRLNARERLSPGFYEVYCDADLKTVRARDVKGLYAKTERGEMTGMIGFSPGSVYEPPRSPDLALDTERQTAEDSIDVLYGFIQESLSVAAAPPPNR